MKGSQYILITFIGLIIICSCANNEQANNIHTVKVSAEVQEKKQKASILPNGDTILTPPYDITVDMEFLDTTYVENAYVCRKINRQLIETFFNTKLTDNGQEAVNIFIRRLQHEYEQEELAPEIYDHYTGKAEFGREGIINYTLVEDYYGGGAHPTIVTSILRFDIHTGERIDINTFFVDNANDSLCEKLTQRLMKQVGAPDIDSLHALGYLEMENMFVSENFLLKKDSISFFYNQYDIAPYAVGSTTLSFSYDELKDYIREK